MRCLLAALGPFLGERREGPEGQSSSWADDGNWWKWTGNTWGFAGPNDPSL